MRLKITIDNETYTLPCFTTLTFHTDDMYIMFSIKAEEIANMVSFKQVSDRMRYIAQRMDATVERLLRNGRSNRKRDEEQ